jgi:hypothetical protein
MMAAWGLPRKNASPFIVTGERLVQILIGLAWGSACLRNDFHLPAYAPRGRAT